MHILIMPLLGFMLSIILSLNLSVSVAIPTFIAMLILLMVLWLFLMVHRLLHVYRIMFHQIIGLLHNVWDILCDMNWVWLLNSDSYLHRVWDMHWNLHRDRDVFLHGVWDRFFYRNRVGFLHGIWNGFLHGDFVSDWVWNQYFLHDVHWVVVRNWYVEFLAEVGFHSSSLVFVMLVAIVYLLVSNFMFGCRIGLFLG